MNKANRWIPPKPKFELRDAIAVGHAELGHPIQGRDFDARFRDLA
jgi:hypothetical protein